MKGQMMGVVDNVVAAVRTVRDVAKTIEDAELKTAIADLMIETADLKGQMAQLMDENRELKKKRDYRSLLTFKDHHYHAEEPIPGYGKGPFCPTCLDSFDQLVNVHRQRNGTYYCDRCNMRYNAKNA